MNMRLFWDSLIPGYSVAGSVVEYSPGLLATDQKFNKYPSTIVLPLQLWVSHWTNLYLR